MPDVVVRPVPIRDIRRLRSELLRPFEPPEALVYVGDDAPDTFHVGAFLADELVGIATACRDPLPGSKATDEWRLRGVAVRPEVRGRGLGRALLAACLAHATRNAGGLVWCNGRTTAQGFYRTFGFTVVGPEFEVPGTGPHYQFRRPLTPAPGTTA
jgi:GNAT superfamily N-acetyltransferase